MDRLKGKVAVVTGSGRGIGRVLAVTMALEGAKVVVNDLGVTVDGIQPSSQVADEVVAEIRKAGGVAVASYDSVVSWSGAENIIRTAVSNFGRLDILVNNAGILRPRMVWNMAEEEWDGVLNTHLKGTFNCCHFASIQMKEQNYGRILNVTSSVGMQGAQSLSNYAAAKAGIVGFTRAIAKELSRFNVTVNAYHIGAHTRMSDNPDRLRQERIKQGLEAPDLAARRRARERPEQLPEQGVPIVIYLASDQAADISGHVFYMGGEKMAVYNLNDQVKQAYWPGGWTVDKVFERFRDTVGAGLPNAVQTKASGD